MRAAVVGAGAWGLPAAAELARRGHDVTLVEAFAPGHRRGSSSGPSRLWRLSHPEPAMVRLAQRAVAAWHGLEQRTGAELLLRTGLLWRGDSAGAVAAALAAEGVDHDAIEAADVGRIFPGLRPNGYDAVWQADAGPVLAARSLQVHLELFVAAGGRLLHDHRVVGVDTGGDGVRLTMDGQTAALAADVVVLAPGPWAVEVLPLLGLRLDLAPVLEQVAYVGGAGWADLPCLYDGPVGDDPGLYAMPTPGHGYKIGLDHPLRPFVASDPDRTPDPGRDGEVARRVSRDFGALEPTVLGSEVCTWTMSPDGRFVIDRVHEGRVVLACGDSGTGFKFSALMGEILADQAEGRTVDEDVAAFALRRFDEGLPPPPPYHVFGSSRPEPPGL